GLDAYKKKNAPKLGDTHLDAAKKSVTMDRYQCNTCHVPQVDAKPLVDNTFVGNVAPGK
ncbi:MAG: nitrate reductase cytochrome c-type subunit, partial [Rhodocyclaceae bacterium]|nr:nitrate reductase cytochrome c-type subunit [Rhodocyclaceae bacterium]